MAEHLKVSRAYGRQLSLHTGLYGLSAVITFVLSIVSLAVLTRFLSLDEFGQLALLLFFAALVTIVANLATLQGSFLWVFGSSGEEGGDVAEGEPSATDKRTALTTGLILTALVAGLLVGAVVLVAEPTARALTGTAEQVAAFKLATLSGGLGAVWRFVVNVMRYERRPTAFVVLNAIRPIVVLGITVPLVASGGGVTGALLGITIGTGVATIAALLATWRSYGLSVDWAAASPIVRRGAFLVPVIVSFWVVQNVDLYLVSVYASDADVARYRVASRVGAGVSYFASAFLMAWLPLTRTVLHAAVDREHGHTEVTAKIVTYFAAACLWITLGLAVLADLLIRIAPTTYESAAPLIPLIGLGFVAYGLFMVLYRGVRIPAKRGVYATLACGAALVFLASALLLIPAIGVYGAAIAPIAGFSSATAAILALSQRGAEPIPFEYGLLARAAAAAAACLGVNVLVAPLLGDWRIIADGAVLVAFPVLLAFAGVVQAKTFWEFAKGFLSRSGPDTPPPEDEQAGPAPDSLERRVLDLLVDRRCAPGEAASACGMSEPALLASFVRTLRQTGGLPPDASADEAIGRYLLSSAGVAERDAMARGLLARGIEPGELLRLESALERLRLMSSTTHQLPLPTNRFTAATRGSNG